MIRALRGAAQLFALVGGLVLLLVAALTTASVIGRWLFAVPVPGDVELVQLGTASALALFLPHCQLHGSHLIVDIFTAHAPAALHHHLNFLVRVLAALTLSALAWRAAVGLVDLYAARETTMVLGWPLWIAYSALPAALALTAAVALLDEPPQAAAPASK